MELEFTGELWFWKGPAPHHFVTVPEPEADQLAAVAPGVSYGYGMIPVTVRLGATEAKTALGPKDGGYIVPVTLAIRRAENIGVTDIVTVRLTVG